MENLEVTISLPCLKLNIPEDSLNFRYIERIIFNLTRARPRIIRRALTDNR